MISKFRIECQRLEKMWQQGVGGVDQLREYSMLVDRFLISCFHKTAVAKKDNSVALVAVGGYGRQELFPRSDIDLMILFRSGYEEIGKIADSILYPLWDTGLEVGHGVRSVDESVNHAAEDYFFRVALLDARLICGSADLFEELEGIYRSRFVDGHREEFVVETIAAIYYRSGNVSNSPLTHTLLCVVQGFPQAKGRRIRKTLQPQACHPAILSKVVCSGCKYGYPAQPGLSYQGFLRA